MIQREQNGVHWLEFSLLAECPKVKHAVFLRHGGASKAEYDSLNFSYSVGDDQRHVDENYTTAKTILNWDWLARGMLEHGNVIQAVSTQTDALIGLCDALATEIPYQALAITHADCQAALLYDPINHALVNIHSGWRGNVKNIYDASVRFMKKNYNSNPADILACISPSLGPEHAEFIHYKTELPQTFWPFQTKPNYFNFWEIAEMQLQEAGIQANHIEIAGICTYANTTDYFSYRRQKKSGRHATIAMVV